MKKLIIVISVLAIFGVVSIGLAMTYQILNPQLMSKYLPNQYQLLNDGAVVLNPGVEPIAGTVKEYGKTNTNIGAVPGPDIYSEYLNLNGLTTYVKTGTFPDSTTTAFAVKNPFNATSTLDLAILNFTNGTSTMVFIVATSTDRYADSIGSSDGSIINSPVTATSVSSYIVNGTTLGADVGFQTPGTNSKARVVVGPSEWVLGKVFASDQEGNAITANDTAFTETANTFTGKYTLRFIR